MLKSITIINMTIMTIITKKTIIKGTIIRKGVMKGTIIIKEVMKKAVARVRSPLKTPLSKNKSI